MDLEYSSCDGLFELIRQINFKYYGLLNSNILYLEEVRGTNYVAYIIELRDAYSHFVRVFDYDVMSEQGKRNVQSHLASYANHLRRGVLDTFQKILEVEVELLAEVVPERDMVAIKHQLAIEMHRGRIMDIGISVDDRIEGYKDLLSYISTVRKKFVPSV